MGWAEYDLSNELQRQEAQARLEKAWRAEAEEELDLDPFAFISVEDWEEILFDHLSASSSLGTVSRLLFKAHSIPCDFGTHVFDFPELSSLWEDFRERSVLVHMNNERDSL